MGFAEDSYARGLLILEQCDSTQNDDYSKGLVELARSTLLFERFYVLLDFSLFFLFCY